MEDSTFVLSKKMEDSQEYEEQPITIVDQKFVRVQAKPGVDY